jgi:hypothetical protein
VVLYDVLSLCGVRFGQKFETAGGRRPEGCSCTASCGERPRGLYLTAQLYSIQQAYGVRVISRIFVFPNLLYTSYCTVKASKIERLLL